MRCETEIPVSLHRVLASSSISARRAPAQLRLHLNQATIITFPGRP